MHQIHIDDEHALLDYLRLSKPHWCTPPICANSWIFRGHANAEWPLVASLYRNALVRKWYVHDSIERVVAMFRTSGFGTDLSDSARRNLAEMRLLLIAEYPCTEEFLRIAHTLGLIDAGIIRSMTEETRRRYFEWAPPQEATQPDEGTALAQHHCVPTRLLDWTTTGVVAAWFAASEARRLLLKGERISECAIWALSTYSFGDGRIKLVKPLRGANPYLRAQAGVFTWDRDGDAQYVVSGSPGAQESHLDNLCFGKAPPGLVKITFPSKLAVKLCGLLLVEGVTKARVMPTLDNVANDVLPRWTEDVF